MPVAGRVSRRAGRAGRAGRWSQRQGCGCSWVMSWLHQAEHARVWVDELLRARPSPLQVSGGRAREGCLEFPETDGVVGWNHQTREEGVLGARVVKTQAAEGCAQQEVRVRCVLLGRETGLERHGPCQRCGWRVRERHVAAAAGVDAFASGCSTCCCSCCRCGCCCQVMPSCR